MKENILILGSGKMAKDIGLFLLKRDNTITWVSRDKQRLGKLKEYITKQLKRLIKTGLYPRDDFHVHFCSYSELKYNGKKNYTIILETINESLDEKRGIFKNISGCFSDKTILLSNSSSILPHLICPRLAGFHFFFPIELTAFCEIIFPEGFSAKKRDRIVQLALDWNLKYLVQGEENAFTANKILLPVQAKSLQLVKEGLPVSIVDKLSSPEIMPAGQLTLMDSVGLDVIWNAASNYKQTEPFRGREDINQFCLTLKEIIDLGKFGKKNKNGLMMGESLPWQTKDIDEREKKILKKKIIDCFINTCHNFIEKKIAGKSMVEMILKDLFQSELSCYNAG